MSEDSQVMNRGVRGRSPLGVVGYGVFGRFMCSHLRRDFDLLVHDPGLPAGSPPPPGIVFADSVEQLSSQQTVVLAVPVQQLEQVLRPLAASLAPGSLVVDTCSVKAGPLEQMLEILPAEVGVVGTHPMFGPQSGAKGISGLKVVLCEGRGGREECVRTYLKQELSLEVIARAPEVHDREMAYIQGLTHWMAKALREIKMPDLELSTVAYRHMMKIEEMLREDSDDLFRTIAGGNPFAREARRELVDRLLEIERWLEDGETPSGSE